jgi:hypothetical protein
MSNTVKLPKLTCTKSKPKRIKNAGKFGRKIFHFLIFFVFFFNSYDCLSFKFLIKDQILEIFHTIL